MILHRLGLLIDRFFVLQNFMGKWRVGSTVMPYLEMITLVLMLTPTSMTPTSIHDADGESFLKLDGKIHMKLDGSPSQESSELLSAFCFQGDKAWAMS